MNVRIIAAAIVASAMLLSGAGCRQTPLPLAPGTPDVGPPATTPQGAVRRLEWAINNREADAVRQLLTDDFTFITAGTDSAGNPVRSPWPRDSVIAAIQGMLVGWPNRPPAENVTLRFDRNLVSLPDPRPGKNPTWHKMILTSVDLTVRIDASNSVEVTGNARFFLTRGDSVAIPVELEARGVKPDSSRWWIDQWVDETLGGGLVANLRAARGGSPPGRMPQAVPMKPRGGTRIRLVDLLRFYLP